MRSHRELLPTGRTDEEAGASPSSFERQTLGDLLSEAADEAVRIDTRIPAGPERIMQLGIGQPLQAAADPAHIGRGDVLEQRIVTPAPVELDTAVDDPLDEWCLLEYVDVAARSADNAGPAERMPEVARDVPGAGAFVR